MPPGSGGGSLSQALIGAGASQAQEFPAKPVTIVVPFAAGGPTDTVARLVAQAMSTNLKQTVLIENVGGAGGTVGAGRVARAPGDGYTLLMIAQPEVVQPALRKNMPYDILKDFSAISLIATGSSVRRLQSSRLNPSPDRTVPTCASMV